MRENRLSALLGKELAKRLKSYVRVILNPNEIEQGVL